METQCPLKRMGRESGDWLTVNLISHHHSLAIPSLAHPQALTDSAQPEWVAVDILPPKNILAHLSKGAAL